MTNKSLNHLIEMIFSMRFLPKFRPRFWPIFLTLNHNKRKFLALNAIDLNKKHFNSMFNNNMISWPIIDCNLIASNLTEVTSSSDGEIINGDSGFQEIANTADVDVKDVAVDEGNAHETDSHTGNNNVTQDDMDDNESIVSDLSCGTCISDMSADEWKPISGPIAWVHHQMCSGTDPRDILADMIPDNTLIPAHLDSITLWRIILNMLSEPPRRKKLPNINTLDDVVKLIHRCNKIILLTGAGVSICLYRTQCCAKRNAALTQCCMHFKHILSYKCIAWHHTLRI